MSPWTDPVQKATFSNHCHPWWDLCPSKDFGFLFHKDRLLISLLPLDTHSLTWAIFFFVEWALPSKQCSRRRKTEDLWPERSREKMEWGVTRCCQWSLTLCHQRSILPLAVPQGIHSSFLPLSQLPRKASWDLTIRVSSWNRLASHLFTRVAFSKCESKQNSQSMLRSLPAGSGASGGCLWLGSGPLGSSGYDGAVGKRGSEGGGDGGS